MTEAELAALAWDKMDGLLPAAVQDRASGTLLMLGYMNRDALRATQESGFVTFFSRSKQRLWMKGESSGNRLALRGLSADCDGDALLVLADPQGPTCHTGAQSCFGELSATRAGWLADLSAIVARRAESGGEASYTRELLRAGAERIAQKVGEEGVEVALAAVTRDASGCAEEVADLLYHVTVLLHLRGMDWPQVMDVLRRRHEPAPSA